jgi:hypothetical protein
MISRRADGGAPRRASQRHAKASPPAASSTPELRPGDQERWPYHAGAVTRVLADGLVEILCATDGRRWRLPVAELARD